MIFSFVNHFSVRLFIYLSLLLFAHPLVSQSMYRTISDTEVSLSDNQERTIVPDHYHLVQMNLSDMDSYLRTAPHELDVDRKNNELQLEVPMPDGTSRTFMMYESPTMMEEISARYPMIKSYKGYARSNPSENLRVTVNPNGFFAAIKTDEGTVYIDPYASNDLQHYMSYFVTDDHSNVNPNGLACGSDAEITDLAEQLGDIDTAHGESLQISTRGDNIPLRQYRLALACTGEFGQRRDNITEVLADLNTSVARLNMIFENDLSIRMILVNQNDEIIYDNPQTDPYPIPTQFPPNDGTGRWLLRTNTSVLNTSIGDGSYDLGHVYHSACTDVGGVAYLGSICGDIKGGGVSCDAFNSLSYLTVSIAAHEMGHQLGSPHSFNNCTGDGNESLQDGFEPGSGTTIMSYAGLCGQNNVQSNNDDYYHSGSLLNIYRTTREINGSTCAEEINIDNHEPDIQLDIENGFFIPIGTPFLLTADATDEDGDNMTYSWEQMNTGPLSPLGSPNNNAPLFRVFPPTSEKTRIFPASNRIIANSFRDDEILPTINRDMDFNFVARDNNPEGGTASWQEVSFRATADAGPFRVTYPNTINIEMEQGEEVTVEWDVANTDGSLVNCSAVDIYLSYSGELNSDLDSDDLKLLALSAPNDGSHEVVVPTRISSSARILIRANNNVFFDISNNAVFIVEASTPAVFFETAIKTE